MQVINSRLIFFLFFYISDVLISQSVQLNEIVSSNATIIKDEDGDYSDWIEIFNNSDSNISIDGFDISKVELKSLRNQIGIVPQEPLLFNGTIRDNIALKDYETTEKEIIQASKKACAHDFIMKLPDLSLIHI